MWDGARDERYLPRAARLHGGPRPPTPGQGGSATGLPLPTSRSPGGRRDAGASSGADPKASATKWAAAAAQQLLTRHGILTREAVGAENLPGGFGVIYPVLKAMEEHGRIRRGYFVAGLGATQFALPGALDLLRSLRTPDDEPEVVVLAATDPANPWGTALKVPAAADKAGRFVRIDRRNSDPGRRRARRLPRAR